MIRKTLHDTYQRMKLVRNRNHIMRVESENMDRLSLVVLTKEEYLAVAKRWEGVSKLKILPKYYQMFKTLEHYDPDFVSDDLFMPFILRKLNEKSEAEAFVHKGLYDILFKNEIKRPKTLVNNINGTFYLPDMKPISHDEAVSILKNEQCFIIKPTIGSCMGKGVKKVEAKTVSIDSILTQYKKNFITQQVVRQSALTAEFNPCSLNTFRISTLNINGRVSVCSIIFKCGQSDSIIDNGGAGGLMVGIDDAGYFREYGYNNKYEKFYETKNGVKFEGKYVGSLSIVLDKIKEVHQKCIPSMGFAGWDVALDEHNEPVMIEVNLVWPGIQFEQLCPGSPIFGDRTAEVIDYLRNIK